MNWIKNIFGNKGLVKAGKLNSQSTTLAVLPFKNLSGSIEQDYYSDGVSEEIINSLSAVPGLAVISRNCSNGFKKFQDLQAIVQRAKLGIVIQGNIERTGNDLKLKIELIDFNRQLTIWSKNYEVAIEETRLVLSDIVKNVLQSLSKEVPKRVEMDGESGSKIEFEAYDLFLNGRYNLNQRGKGLILGVDLFKDSLKIDSTCAPAYAGLSQSYNLQGFYEFKKPILVYPAAKDAALKALELDSTLVEAHTSLAFEQMLYEWDWASAEREFLHALNLNPGYVTAHHWYAEFLMATGRFEEGIQQARKAQKFDPFGLIINTLLGMAYFLSGNFERAIAEGEKTLQMSSAYLPVFIWLGLSYCKTGQLDKAISLFEKGRAISKNKNAKMTSLLAYAYATDGREDDANLIKNELDIMGKYGYVSALEQARFAVGRGDKELAMALLEDAIEERSTGLVWLKVNPIFDELRSEPRFAETIAKMNFPK